MKTTCNRPVRGFLISETCNFHNETFQCHDQRSTMIKIDQHHYNSQYETCNGSSPLGSPVFHEEAFLSRMGFSFRQADTATFQIVTLISKITSLLDHCLFSSFSYELSEEYDRPWLLHGRIESSNSPFSIRLRFSKLSLLPPPPSPPKVKINPFNYIRQHFLKGESRET